MERRHTIRDAVHGFISFDDRERDLINLPLFQRLRFIRQLGGTPWVYPGANHTRFEHSLGVMHVAGLLFDRVQPDLASVLGFGNEELAFMRRLLRLASLLHDLGHPPFSHVTEQLHPLGAVSHEEVAWKLIQHESIAEILRRPPIVLTAEMVGSVCLDPKEKAELIRPEALDTKYLVLSSVLTGDLLGADRMDYLLRDAHHAGVAYGHFDLPRVIDTMRVIVDAGGNPVLCIEEGGLHAAEGMLLARYFMFAQVYHHRVRRIYDFMIRQAARADVPGGVDGFLLWTDDELLTRARSEFERNRDVIYRCLFQRTHPRPVIDLGFQELRRMKESPNELARSLKVALDEAGYGDDLVWVDSEEKAGASEAVKDMPVVRDGTTDLKGTFGQFSGVPSLLPQLWLLRVYPLRAEDEREVRQVSERVLDGLR